MRCSRAQASGGGLNRCEMLVYYATINLAAVPRNRRVTYHFMAHRSSGNGLSSQRYKLWHAATFKEVSHASCSGARRSRYKTWAAGAWSHTKHTLVTGAARNRRDKKHTNPHCLPRPSRHYAVRLPNANVSLCDYPASYVVCCCIVRTGCLPIGYANQNRLAHVT